MLTKEEKEIVEKIKKVLGYDAPKITQSQFDKIVEHIMKYENVGGNPKELVWRLCGCYRGFNFNKVIDIYVDSKDYYYTSELVSYVKGELDQEYLTKKMIETNDLKFIDKAMSSCGCVMASFMDKKYVQELANLFN